MAKRVVRGDGVITYGAGMGEDFECIRSFLNLLLKFGIENRHLQFDDMWDYIDRFFEGKVRDSL